MTCGDRYFYIKAIVHKRFWSVVRALSLLVIVSIFLTGVYLSYANKRSVTNITASSNNSITGKSWKDQPVPNDIQEISVTFASETKFKDRKDFIKRLNENQSENGGIIVLEVQSSKFSLPIPITYSKGETLEIISKKCSEVINALTDQYSNRETFINQRLQEDLNGQYLDLLESGLANLILPKI